MAAHSHTELAVGNIDDDHGTAGRVYVGGIPGSGTLQAVSAEAETSSDDSDDDCDPERQTIRQVKPGFEAPREVMIELVRLEYGSPCGVPIVDHWSASEKGKPGYASGFSTCAHPYRENPDALKREEYTNLAGGEKKAYRQRMCPFFIAFGLSPNDRDAKTTCIVLEHKMHSGILRQFNTEHNHPIIRHRPGIPQCVGIDIPIVRFKSELEPEEVAFLTQRSCLQFLPQNHGTLMASEMCTFFRKQFDPDMIRRFCQTIHTSFVMSEEEANSEFYAEMHRLKLAGGVYSNLKTDRVGDGLNGIVWATAEMLEYRKFAKMVIVDATFNSNKYGWKLIAFCTSCSLGKTRLLGLLLSPRESGPEIKAAMDLLFPALHDFSTVTLMSDEGPAYAEVASNLGMIHVLCRKHYKKNCWKAGKGMQKEVRSRFQVPAPQHMPRLQQHW